MLRCSFLALIAVGLLATKAFAVVELFLDEFDDIRLIHAASQNEKFKASRNEIQELSNLLQKRDRVALTAVLGKPAEKPAKTYAMPLGETRSITLPGLLKADDNRPDKDFVSFHPVGDFAAVEAYYDRYQDVDKPLAVRIYLRTDKAFPKLTKDNLEQRLAWDRGLIRKLVEQVGVKADALPAGASRSQLKKQTEHIGKASAASFADAIANPLALGDWSAPVDDLRGRLVIAEGRILGDSKTRETVLLLELQHVSEALGKEPLNVYFENKLRCELNDAAGKPVPPTKSFGSGGRPGSSWVTLPCDSSVRLRFGLYGHGRPKETGLLIPLADKAWLIPANAAGDYFLSGTFTVNPPADSGKERAWKGTLELPKMKITAAQR